jgi:hypothetical protein
MNRGTIREEAVHEAGSVGPLVVLRLHILLLGSGVTYRE